MRFYLGSHMPHWLSRVDVPLFVSHVRLEHRVTLPRARVAWALDSGAFSEVALTGAFRTTPTAYVAAVRRYRDEIGRMDWAAPQDHMCEPWVLAKSRLASTVPEAQAWTIRSVQELRALAPDLPIIPVLQGQTVGDYLDHVEQYAAAGIDIRDEVTVGVGSVCRRQATDEIARIIVTLADLGLRLHGFGVKADGLRRYGWALTSSDSMAWSYTGRDRRPCPHSGVSNCANCLPWALEWRDTVVDHEGGAPVQMSLI